MEAILIGPFLTLDKRQYGVDDGVIANRVPGLRRAGDLVALFVDVAKQLSPDVELAIAEVRPPKPKRLPNAKPVIEQHRK